MSTNTTRQGLVKPAVGDQVDITVLDADLDTIDLQTAWLNKTNAATSAMTLDLSLASDTAGLKVPTKAGAAPTADGFVAVDSTAHTLVHGSNGSTKTVADLTSGAVAQTIGGTGAAAPSFTTHGVVVQNAGFFATTGAGTSGQVLTSNGASADPTFQGGVAWKELGYASTTSSQTVTSTATPGTDLTSLTVTCTPDGTHPVYVDLMLPDVEPSTSTATATIAIQKDGTVVAAVRLLSPNAGALDWPVSLRYRDSAPSNASHIYKASAFSSGAQNIAFTHSATQIASITVYQVMT